MLEAFFPRGYRKRLRSDTPRTVALVATDFDARWVVEIGPEGATATRGAGNADDVVSATASDLYLLLWNRRSDAAWPASAKVTWS